MSRRTWSSVAALTVVVGLAVIGVLVPVPFVAISRGPTFDTLGRAADTDIVAVTGLPTYPTSGHLNMTTVNLTDRLTTTDALALWVSDGFQLVPRDAVYPPGVSETQVVERNRRDFADSQANAEGAAFSYLGLPTQVVVGEVPAGSPSAGTLEVDDVLVAVGGHPLATFQDLRTALADTHPGQQLTVRYQRGAAAPVDAVVTLGTRPGVSQGALGLTPSVRPTDPDAVVISLGDIGGPSAGLMFAMAIVDKLTPGELTGGRFVAGTGTIGADGVVGKIDGIPFKMRGAREAGATVFMVPAANCAQAEDTAPDGLQLVKVDDLAGAVASLDTLRAGGSPPGCDGVAAG